MYHFSISHFFFKGLVFLTGLKKYAVYVLMVLFVVRSLESLLDCDREVSGKDVIPDTVG